MSGVVVRGGEGLASKGNINCDGGRTLNSPPPPLAHPPSPDDHLTKVHHGFDRRYHGNSTARVMKRVSNPRPIDGATNTQTPAAANPSSPLLSRY
ncbi:hypothetical protein J6590_033861 [Homalodisca vitripennis]|nr:hypothetical protein J6590_033861 [Homalodisca vitripennis]